MPVMWMIGAALLADPAPSLTDWTVMAVSEESAFAVDRSSIRAEGPERVFEAAVVRMRPEPFEGERTFDYEVTRFRVDCEARTIRRTRHAVHARGEAAPLSAWDLEAPEPEAVGPDGAFHKAWGLVCGGPYQAFVWEIRDTADNLVDITRQAPALFD